MRRQLRRLRVAGQSPLRPATRGSRAGPTRATSHGPRCRREAVPRGEAPSCGRVRSGQPVRRLSGPRSTSPRGPGHRRGAVTARPLDPPLRAAAPAPSRAVSERVRRAARGHAAAADWLGRPRRRRQRARKGEGAALLWGRGPAPLRSGGLAGSTGRRPAARGDPLRPHRLCGAGGRGFVPSPPGGRAPRVMAAPPGRVCSEHWRGPAGTCGWLGITARLMFLSV